MRIGRGLQESQKVGKHTYRDGGWDLFSSGHIEFLRLVTETEEKAAKERGWYTEEASQARIDKAGEDYGPVFLVAGIHEDEVINTWKGINYPIMNIFERGLCVLQCKVSDLVSMIDSALSNSCTVHTRCSLRLTVLAIKGISLDPALRNSVGRLPWDNIFYATDVRFIRRSQISQDLSRNRESQFPKRECWGNRPKDNERSRSIRGASTNQG